MPKVWQKQFLGGMDARRLPETTPAGVLLEGFDCHINRGGEIEKRAAFVSQYPLPTGTIGLAADRNGLYVFGSDENPGGLPVGVNYQRLQHPDGTSKLVRLLSYTLFGGRIYAVGLFSDNSVFHFYDGNRVEAWYDGRASASFSVIGGTAGAYGSGTFDVINIPAEDVSVSAITVGTKPLINQPIDIPADTPVSTIAQTIVSAINSFSSDFIASSDGSTVIIQTAEMTAEENDKDIIVTDNATPPLCGNFTPIELGQPKGLVTEIRVGGISIIAGSVEWITSNEQAAADLANAINSTTSDPEYVAEVEDNRVTIFAELPGPAANGLAVEFSKRGDFMLSPETGLKMDGGATSTDGIFQPGSFVKTVGSKVYAVSRSNLHFSGIKEPTKWTTDATGAGFIDMSTESSGAEELTAIGKYNNNLAVFAGRTVQIWYVDPDPALNRQLQVLENTGTIAPHSVTNFGDNDVFYLDRSGIRSLKARNSSNAAFSSDIGNPIDPYILEVFKTLTDDEESRAIGLIEPEDGRFWLSLHDLIFVFSFFTGSQISAWTIYKPGFVIEYMLAFQQHVYLRNGDTIYSYGGIDDVPVYDDTVALARTPYFDAVDPTRQKRWRAFDIASRGTWNARVYTDPNHPDTSEIVATVEGTTYNIWQIPFQTRTTHLSLEMTSEGLGKAILGSVSLRYESDEKED